MTVLEQHGRVEDDDFDRGVAAHYGDPLREQRRMARDVALVDRSNRGLVVVSGDDRRSWLHSLTSQHLEDIADMSAIEGLVLSPHGHVEQDLWFTAIGDEIWIDTEPGKAAELADYLDRMRFMLRVEVADRSSELSMVSLVGPRAAEILSALELPVPDAGLVVGTPYGYLRAKPWPGEYDVLGTSEQVASFVAAARGAGVEPAGMMAYEALRVGELRPRLGKETDHRTIPHEIGLINKAVHLNKGCYRGQETVARVHNLGRPPRRLVRLHVDGSQHTVPHRGARVMANGRDVGFVGTSEMHFEDGPVALAVIKRNVPDGADVLVVDQADDSSSDGPPAEYSAKVDTGLDL
ncbi:folate-binding protein [Epidermidibacterium keratini]|uniref:Folate-binding protein n=1 Tax=Epidermidibacterium keratini TaxID=1891644 RepID=A0A7L4YLX4_9ACTN|nr:folate-binding protein [Epidermidibacterium keratini]QHB99828.1 folate-binding protein [Epidermidibacterium keratini]